MRKMSSVVLSIVGFLSIIAGIFAIFWGLQADPVILREPEKAKQCAEEFLQAINDGSLAEAADYLPDPSTLGEVPEDADPIAALIWDTYRTQLDAELVSGLYTTADGLCMDMELTALDVDDAVEKIGTLAVERMQERVAATLDMSELYGDDGQYRPELVDNVLQQAALETLMCDLPTVTTSITLHLTQSGEAWVVIPDRALINALSGRG